MVTNQNQNEIEKLKKGYNKPITYNRPAHRHVEVARKMKAIESMYPQIIDIERRLSIMQGVEPVLENGIKTMLKVINVNGMR